jgi:CBS-domain-containing membrane protein
MNVVAQRVYRKHRVTTTRVFGFAASYEPTHQDTIAYLVPATWIMSQPVICVREDVEGDDLLELFAHHRIGCIPVVDERGRAVGMITKSDLIDQHRAPLARFPIVASSIMMPIAITLDVHASVAHAAALMCSEAIQHVPLVGANGVLVGVVSAMDVVRWIATNDGLVHS